MTTLDIIEEEHEKHFINIQIDKNMKDSSITIDKEFYEILKCFPKLKIGIDAEDISIIIKVNK